MKRPFVPLLAALVCVGALFAAITASGSPGTPTGYHRGENGTLTIEKAYRPGAPDYTGIGLDGRPVRLSDFDGKTVVITSWSSGCEACRAQAPVLASFQRKAAERGDAAVVGLSRDVSAEMAQIFTEKHDMPYPNVLDPGGKRLLYLPKGVLASHGVPVTLIVDPSGRIAATASEPVTEARLESLVAAAR
ncbi:TlpA family protein disulfide reductase [Streptomyces sp. NPDC058195]|uniref:TlpA family protein disulfide reductase n=1 Tax=Streptomyces sp. NPDC058195 TaxID=3346375 RepID=UPI0036F175DA